MSEPYIRMYAADMRADPKVTALNPAMRYALLQAYDIAKNGPGACDELRSSDGRAMRERELRHLVSVNGSETRAMFERWRSVGLCEIKDGLVCFPNLAKRQGIDRTAAARMRRMRQRKRYGENRNDVTPERYAPVTAQNQNQSTRKIEASIESSTSSPKPRKADPIWDAFTEACPAEGELTKSERGRRNSAAKELRDIDADPADIKPVAARLREKWGPGVAVTPSAIVANWSQTLAEIRPNGHVRKLTPDDFERIAARIADQQATARGER